MITDESYQWTFRECVTTSHWYTQMQVIRTEKFAYESVDGKLLVHLSFGIDKSDPWDPNGAHPTEVRKRYSLKRV